MLGYRPICVKNNTCVNLKGYESGWKQTFITGAPEIWLAHFLAKIDQVLAQLTRFWLAEDLGDACVVREP